MRHEIYIGFHELEPMPPEPEPEQEPRAGETATDQEQEPGERPLNPATLKLLDELRCERQDNPDMASSLQRAWDHIVELDARLEAERSVNEGLRADVISERAHAAQAESSQRQER